MKQVSRITEESAYPVTFAIALLYKHAERQVWKASHPMCPFTIPQTCIHRQRPQASLGDRPNSNKQTSQPKGS